MVYHDTDSCKFTTAELKYAENDVSAMKLYLNSLYGKAVTMNNDYIVVHNSRNPIVIFKKSIIAVERQGVKATIYCAENVLFDVDENYADVIKQLV